MKENYFIDNIWKNMINNKIDVLKSHLENNVLIIDDDGYHKNGFVNQLFTIFAENNTFNITY